MDKGSYTILARSGPSLLSFSEVEIKKNSIQLDPMRLQSAVAVNIKSELPLHYRLVGLLIGTPFETVSSPDSLFQFGPIPPGDFEFAVVAQNPKKPSRKSLIYNAPITITETGSVTSDPIRLSGPRSATAFTLYKGGDCVDTTSLGGGFWKEEEVRGGGPLTCKIFPVDDLESGPGISGSGCALHATFAFAPRRSNFPSHIGIGLDLRSGAGNVQGSLDLSAAKAIVFQMKGEGTDWHLQAEVLSSLSSKNSVRMKIDSISEDWKSYRIELDKNTDVGNESGKNKHKGKNESWEQLCHYVTHLRFQAVGGAKGSSGKVWIDDIRIVFE